MTPTPAETDRDTRLPGLHTAVAVTLCLVGAGLGAYLVRVKLGMELDPENFASSCNFGGKLNCDVVQTSEASMAFGQPLALWGLGTYLATALLSLLANRWRRHGGALVAALATGGALICAHSLYLAYVSSFVIGAYCVYCMGMYAVNLALTATFALAHRRNAPLSAAPASLARPPVLGAVALAFALSFGVALPGHSRVRSQMKEARLAAVKRELAALDAAKAPANAAPAKTPAPAEGAAGGTVKPAANSAAAGAGKPGQTTPAQSAAQAASPSGRGPGAGSRLTIRTHPQGFRYSEEVMRKGRSYFEVPVHAEDFALGPADAPVTVVEFADFECGYCRALTANFKPLKDKYKGKVRWVFKHFPLDNRCNKVMKGTRHPDACVAAKAANCAGLQGKFWPMHDRIYARKLRINAPNLRRWAIEVGVDGAKYDACFADESVAHAKTRRDSMAGRFARIAGTPRTYINGHLVPGVNATEVLDYYLKAALAKAEAAGKQAPAAETAHGMVKQAVKSGRAFWIDAWEASIDAKGRAVSRSGVRPAEASWFEAAAACKSAGKRLCTEEEWITACTGAPAVDNDGDGDFSDDEVEGSLFPYGLFHEAGRCNDDRKGAGPPVATGSMPGCRSPAGIFDQSANLAEWTGVDEKTGVLSGTDFRWGPKATCMKRQSRFGLGYRNLTTGFRCCADKAVPPPVAAELVAHHDHGAEGKGAPRFAIETLDGKKLTERFLRGKVTIVTFFASWCGPCRRELPDLQAFYEQHKAEGLHVLAVGVDTRPQAARTFIEGLKLTYTVALDAKAVSMGAFGVKGMPTAFLVGRDGRIARRLVGINKAKVGAFKTAALALLKKR